MATRSSSTRAKPDLVVRSPRDGPDDDLDLAPETETVVAVLATVKRTGDWEPPERLRVFAFLGKTRLDFSDAPLPGGMTEVRAFALLGKIEILAPPGMEVLVGGSALLGSIDHRLGGGVAHTVRRWLRGRVTGEPPELPPEDEPPLLEVRGGVILGKIAVHAG